MSLEYLRPKGRGIAGSYASSWDLTFGRSEPGLRDCPARSADSRLLPARSTRLHLEKVLQVLNSRNSPESMRGWQEPAPLTFRIRLSYNFLWADSRTPQGGRGEDSQASER